MAKHSITFRHTGRDFTVSHSELIKSMDGRSPENCEFRLEVSINPEDLRWTGKCKCPWLMTYPPCKQCQRGRSYRTLQAAEAMSIDLTKTFQARFLEIKGDVTTFFSVCKGFTVFLSSSFVLTNLQNMCFQRQKSCTVVSLDLGVIFERIMKKYKSNMLLEAGQRCYLDNSKILHHLRMPTSSGSIFPDFANISIRSNLLGLSMSIKMLFRLVSLHHLNRNERHQMHLMQNIAQHIFRMFIRKQMQKLL